MWGIFCSRRSALTIFVLKSSGPVTLVRPTRSCLTFFQTHSSGLAAGSGRVHVCPSRHHAACAALHSWPHRYVPPINAQELPEVKRLGSRSARGALAGRGRRRRTVADATACRRKPRGCRRFVNRSGSHRAPWTGSARPPTIDAPRAVAPARALAEGSRS